MQITYEDPIELMYHISGMEVQWKGFWTLLYTLFLFQRMAKPPSLPFPELESISQGDNEVLSRNPFIHFHLSLHTCTDTICIPPSCIGHTFQQYHLDYCYLFCYHIDVPFYCTNILEF